MLTEQQTAWLETDAEPSLGLRRREAIALRRIFAAPDGFSFQQIAKDAGISTEGVRLAVGRFQKRGLIELIRQPSLLRPHRVVPGPRLLAFFVGMEAIYPQRASGQ